MSIFFDAKLYTILKLLSFRQISRDSPNSRDNSVAVYSEKSTLWGSVKSFANGILNIWKKL